MSRPASLKVGQHIYRISYDRVDHRLAERDMQQEAAGSSDHERLLITLPTQIGADLEPRAESQMKQTLVHEILHCVLNSYATFYARRFVDRPEADIEEDFCLAIEAGLFAVLRENPEVIAWLTSPDEPVKRGKSK